MFFNLQLSPSSEFGKNMFFELLGSLRNSLLFLKKIQTIFNKKLHPLKVKGLPHNAESGGTLFLVRDIYLRK